MQKHTATEDFELRGAAAEILHEAMPRARGDGEHLLAQGLGWFSLGLGTAEVVAPGLLARLIGVPDETDNRELLRAAGLREIASGVGILMRDRRAGWVWARVGGDVMDLALLGSAFMSEDTQRTRLAAATAAVAGVTALDVLCGRRLSGAAANERTPGVERAITVNKSPSEVYAFWHDLENLPRFMRHVESVRSIGPKRTHWAVKGPAGTTVEWDAEIVEDRPDRSIAWRSLPGAEVENDGVVHFRQAPGGRGTEVLVQLRYQPPAGEIGAMVASLFGERPDQQLQEDLRRFKQVMETGEIARSEAGESAFGMTQPGQPLPADETTPYDQFSRGER